jgi:hypothetical protein
VPRRHGSSPHARPARSRRPRLTLRQASVLAVCILAVMAAVAFRVFLPVPQRAPAPAPSVEAAAAAVRQSLRPADGSACWRIEAQYARDLANAATVPDTIQETWSLERAASQRAQHAANGCDPAPLEVIAKRFGR